jgi:hypothetical protein
VPGFRTCHLCGRTIDTDYEPHGRQPRLALDGTVTRDGKTKRMKYDVFCTPSCPQPALARQATKPA